MNKAIIFIAVPCVIALVLINVQGTFYGQGYGYGMGYGSGYGNQQNSQYYQTVLQRKYLNDLSRTTGLAKFINFIPLILLFTVLTNNTALPVIG